MLKAQKVKQYAFVEAGDLDVFEVKLNERMEDLADLDPEVVFYENDPQLARICYTKRVPLPEESPSERGYRFTCGDCPMMKHILKRDGTPDMRRVYGECEFAELGRVYKTSAACDYLYKLLKDGRIRLVLDD